MNNSPQNNTLTVDNLAAAGKPMSLNKSMSIGSQDSDDENESKTASVEKSPPSSASASASKLPETDKKKNVKIAKVAQRPFLFEDEVFMQIFAKIIGNGIGDRGKETREKAMKVLKKIESSNAEILKNILMDCI